MLRRTPAVAFLSLVLLAPAPLVGQEEPEAEPEIRFITLTTFDAPAGDDRETALEWIEEVMVPQARMNPNILSYRAAGHNWGSSGEQIVIMAEYPSWEAIQAECVPCDEWFEEQQPEEGTPEREEWDERLDAFLRLYLTHSDEIYQVNMTDYAKE